MIPSETGIVTRTAPILIISGRCTALGQPIASSQVHRNITMAVSTALHFFIDLVVAFLFTIFMTELTKVATGVLRCALLQCS